CAVVADGDARTVRREAGEIRKTRACELLLGEQRHPGGAHLVQPERSIDRGGDEMAAAIEVEAVDLVAVGAIRTDFGSVVRTDETKALGAEESHREEAAIR